MYFPLPSIFKMQIMGTARNQLPTKANPKKNDIFVKALSREGGKIFAFSENCR